MFIRLFRILRRTGRDLVALLLACRHPDTPGAVKVGAVLLFAYLLSPIDVLPDWFAIFGWTDDILVAAFGVPFLLKHLPANVLHDVRLRAQGWLSPR
ncbi:MAG: hypothetical protein K0S28_960 [Paucimonas sp.]|jgi:uncharacterized membrane protein YkvA (DUF1232 family)|nr:hypothetical protein [Paucimonas sp.]